MRRLILGTAGHIDHGKTALVHALTGIDTDRLAEEKRRGITIDLGFASLRLGTDPDAIALGIADVPGHEAFIRNMLAGATGIDLVLLVVAADEGVMPQTSEHLAIVELLGVRAGVVALTKTDLVEPEWLELVAEDLHSQLKMTPFASAPIVPVSAMTGAGLQALRAALYGVARQTSQRSEDDLFRLPVDRVFTVRGTGTVVTGTVWSGSIARDQTIRVLPSGETARLRGLQVHGVECDVVHAGQRAALALAGVDRERLTRGAVLVAGPAWHAHAMVTAHIRVLPTAAHPIRPRQRVRFHLGTAEVMGRVALLERDPVPPGDTAWVQLRLEAPVVARAGDRFVIRSYSPVTTIGGGIIAEPLAPKRRRLRAAERERLEAVLGSESAAAVLACARAEAWAGADRSRLAIETPHPPAAVAGVAERLEGEGLLVHIGDRIFAREIAEAARQRLLAAVDTFHQQQPLRPGIDRGELRRALPRRAAPPLAEWALAELLSGGTLEPRAGLVARHGFSPHLTREQAQARDRLADLLTHAGLMPPTIPELPASLRSRADFWPLLKLLEHDEQLVALTPDLYIARCALDAAIATARRDLAGRDGLGPADFKAVFQISRKFLIPLLEYFDRTGITTHRGDTRVVALVS